MRNEIIMFTTEQGNLLIRLLLAHFISDFVLQNKYLIENKRWFSKQMLLHITIVFVSTFLLSKSFFISASITVLHWLIDSFKIQIQQTKKHLESKLFFIDQISHILIILIVWALHLNIIAKLFEAIEIPFLNYKLSLIILAYIFVMYPVGFVIKFLTAKISPSKQNIHGSENANSTNILEGGKLIGQFERLIILTFVLLNQYEAIGFLITGKSIIRFAEHDEKLRSEYVLVGTMMSYALAIITGVIVNNLLSL